MVFVGVLAVFGMNSIVGMGRVFVRLLLVRALVMAVFFVLMFIMSMSFMRMLFVDFRAGRRSLDRH